MNFDSVHGSSLTRGQARLEFGRRLGGDWRDLAIALDIPSDHQNKFERGNEASEIWTWLERRHGLGRLSGALRHIGRDDLPEILAASDLSAPRRVPVGSASPHPEPGRGRNRRLTILGAGVLALLLVVAVSAFVFINWPDASEGDSKGPPGYDDLRKSFCSEGGATVVLSNHHTGLYLGGGDRPQLTGEQRPLRVHASPRAASVPSGAPGCAVTVRGAAGADAMCLARADGGDVRWWSPCGNSPELVWLMELHWTDDHDQRWEHIHPLEDWKSCLQPVPDGNVGIGMTVRSCGGEWEQHWRVGTPA